MKISVEMTEEGSTTLFLPEKNEHYHSVHGPIQEADCVYLNTALRPFLHGEKRPLRVLEMGFGTGLNAVLTWIEAEKDKTRIEYTALEKYPLPEDILRQLNYSRFLETPYTTFLEQLHRTEWVANGQSHYSESSPYFHFQKIKVDLLEWETLEKGWDVVFFDAFAPDVQPELWTREVFRKIYEKMSPHSILSTYCVKGEVRRNLKSAGFQVTKLPGPKGKREITQALKDE